MANTTNFNWETPDDTDLVKDGAAAIRTLGSAIDTSLVDLKGGTTGQVLSKATNTDMDFTWVAQDDSNAIQNALLTTTGDTIYASSASTPARLGIGSSGQCLTVVAGVPSWAASATSVLTTTGDLLYASAANTLARRAIGSSGDVLTVSGGVPTWAAPASAGGMTQLASGSLAASATGFDLTSISGSYNELWLYISDLSADATGGAGYNTSLYLNNDTTGSNYSFTGTVAGTVVNRNNIVYGFELFSTETVGADFSCLVRIPNYTDATSSQIITAVGHQYPTNQVKQISGIWTATPAAITRLTLKIGGGAYDGGTYKLYGVK